MSRISKAQVNRLAKLISEDILSDMVIKLGDDTEMRVHSQILFMLSDYFATLCTSKFKESEEHVLDFSVYNPIHVRLCVDHFYNPEKIEEKYHAYIKEYASEVIQILDLASYVGNTVFANKVLKTIVENTHLDYEASIFILDHIQANKDNIHGDLLNRICRKILRSSGKQFYESVSMKEIILLIKWSGVSWFGDDGPLNRSIRLKLIHDWMQVHDTIDKKSIFDFELAHAEEVISLLPSQPSNEEIRFCCNILKRIKGTITFHTVLHKHAIWKGYVYGKKELP